MTRTALVVHEYHFDSAVVCTQAFPFLVCCRCVNVPSRDPSCAQIQMLCDFSNVHFNKNPKQFRQKLSTMMKISQNRVTRDE